MNFRKATQKDINSIEKIYSDTHAQEERGEVTIGWVRSVYPTRATAEQALLRGDLFLCELDGEIVATAIINQQQVAEYYGANWEYTAEDSEVMVLHTLVVSPSAAGQGVGKAFVKFYEDYALSHGCNFLRMDTNAKNLRARAMYKKLGYNERGIIPCIFNGIQGVDLVLLEKKI